MGGGDARRGRWWESARCGSGRYYPVCSFADSSKDKEIAYPQAPCSSAEQSAQRRQIGYEGRGTSLINSIIFPSGSRKASIQRSYVFIGAIRRGGASIFTPISMSRLCAALISGTRN